MESKIKQILAKKLGPNKQIKNMKFQNLPQMGVTSSMLKVKVTLKDQNGSEEVLHLVAKILKSTEIAQSYKI